jgi:hypothetical protein
MNIVRADEKVNRLYIKLARNVDRESAEALLDMIFKESQKLQSGFDVITDLTQLVVGHVGAGEVLRRIMEYLETRGVRKVVRIIGKSKLALTQFARAGQGFRGYKPVYARSIRDAEAMLEGLALAETQSKKNTQR